jgi:hypothetical protein
MTQNTLIDWSRPVEYADGSPVYGHRAYSDDYGDEACYYNGRRAIRIVDGNYYDETGMHIYGHHLAVRNVQPTETPSWDFSVDPAAVLEGARGLHSIALVGINSDGDVVVSSSTGTPQTLNLFAQARAKIAELAA